MSLLDAFQTHRDTPAELVNICGKQFFEHNLCRIVDDLRLAFLGDSLVNDGFIAAAAAVPGFPTPPPADPNAWGGGYKTYAYFQNAFVAGDLNTADANAAEQSYEQSKENYEQMRAQYQTGVDGVNRARLTNALQGVRLRKAEFDAEQTKLKQRRRIQEIIAQVYPGGLRKPTPAPKWIRIRTERFAHNTNGVMDARAQRLRKMGGAAFSNMDPETTDAIFSTVVRMSYVQYDADVDGFYYDRYSGNIRYQMGRRTENDCRWTPLILHINTPMVNEWSLHVFWNACIARCMSKEALRGRSQPLCRLVKGTTDLPFDPSIVVDLLPFTTTTPGALPGTPSGIPEFRSLLRDSMRLKAWGDARPIQQPDLGGVAKHDVDEIWYRATRDDSVERGIETNETLVLIEDAIKEYLYQTPPYQVAATVAGFNGSQVSQLYYERVFNDVVNVFTGTNLAPTKQPEEPSEQHDQRVTKRRRRTFDAIVETLSPSELRAGMVSQAKMHKLLRMLFETPEWRARIHWRPNLHAHYFDVLQFVEQRLNTVNPESNYLAPLRIEIKQRATVLYGMMLFKSDCADIHGGRLADDWKRVEGREDVSFLGVENALKAARIRHDDAVAKLRDARAAWVQIPADPGPYIPTTAMRTMGALMRGPTAEQRRLAAAERARIDAGAAAIAGAAGAAGAAGEPPEPPETHCSSSRHTRDTNTASEHTKPL